MIPRKPRPPEKDLMKRWITDAVTAPAPLELEAHAATLRQRPGLSSVCKLHLQRFVSATSGVTAAIVATSDGFEVASVLHTALSPEKMAAMTSSILALGEAVLSEAGLSNCQNVVIEADGGLIVMLSIGDPKGELLLSVITDGNAMLGQVLWAARRCCQDVRSAVAVPAKGG